MKMNMIPPSLKSPRFGQIHVLSRTMNDAVQQQMRISLAKGSAAIFQYMGDDTSNRFTYHMLSDNCGIILTDNITTDRADFSRYAAQKSVSLPAPTELYDEFLFAKSIDHKIHWIGDDEE